LKQYTGTRPNKKRSKGNKLRETEEEKEKKKTSFNVRKKDIIDKQRTQDTLN
jgi:hypothetical protein